MKVEYKKKKFPSITGCSFEGCTGKHEARGLCKNHWMQGKRKNNLPSKKTLKERFYERIKKTDSCWEWQGVIAENGYGRLTHNYKFYSAHRLSLIIHNVTLIEGLCVDHLCRNRNCVNPKHLRQITNKENILAGIGICSKNSKKTHCKRGHEFNEQNTRFYRSSRYCKKCRSIYRKNSSLKNKDLSPLKQS